VSLSHRVATPADARAIAELVAAHDSAHHAVSDGFSEQDVLDWWKRIDEGDAVVVMDEDGRLVGTGAVRRRGDNYLADNFTHPDFRGRGVGSYLVDWSERRAAEAGAAALRVAVAAPDAAAKALLEARGFGYIRSFYRMSIDLEEPPPSPRWPEGFTVTTMQPGEERVVHEVVSEAFLDHWDYQARPFDEWLPLAHIEPALCFLVRDEEGATVAVEWCNEERFGSAWVDVLGVRRAWRRLGLGEALLQLAFGELYGRGRGRIGLGVDAANPTGATRLYERVGMSVAAQEDVYEKPLQPVGE
jgi:mycothiol synthase